MAALLTITGVVLTIVVVADMVRSMLVPHGSRAPIARMTSAAVLGVYGRVMRLAKTFPQQDRILATAAPVALLAQLVVYVTVLILTMGLVVRGTSDLDMTTALYQSGSTLTTLGIVAPVSAASAVATMVAAFLGLVAIAVFIGYALGLNSAYTARESQMARLSLLAGEPAWGPIVLARAHALGMRADDAVDWSSWTSWICDVRTNATVNPLLSLFRSTSSLRHWTTSMLAVLDAAALRAALDPASAPPAVIELLAEGSVAAQVLTGTPTAHNWDGERDVLRVVRATPDALVAHTNTAHALTDADWSLAVSCLSGAGVPLPADAAEQTVVRTRLDALRALYAPQLIAVARRLHAVPAPWSGDRDPHVSVPLPLMPTGSLA